MFKTKRLMAILAVILCVMCTVNIFALADAPQEEVPQPETTTEIPGYAQYAYENNEPEIDSELPLAEQLEILAQTYIDNYDSAIQNDPNVSANYKAAIEQIRNDVTPFYASIWAILPPVIAIALALITKEVYSSLFIGILSGGLLYSVFSFEGTLVHVVEDGFVTSLSDSYNVGILVFLVLLGALVCMMNKSGGSAAFGRWASTHIKARLPGCSDMHHLPWYSNIR